MFDKNGIEIKRGDIVKIEGGYFKNDNGLWFVEHVPGEPNWNGSDCSLRKIGKTGKLSTQKHNICFWPLSVYVNDYFKRCEAKAWNEKNATIEIVAGVNKEGIIQHFEEEKKETEQMLEWYGWHFGEESDPYKLTAASLKDIEKTIKRIA